MANEKELIQKLSTIVAKQQKIITKLAQMMPEPMSGGGLMSAMQDVSLDLQTRLSAVPGAKGYRVESAEAGGQTGTLRAQIKIPMADQHFRQISDALRNAMKGATLKTNDGRNVQVSSNPEDISFTALRG